tara:strand:- start:322 stop:1002 length:681 start_codon:yes stop_codon:yes gene_type:complete
MSTDDISKVILVNKPLEWTSFDVVKKIRSVIKRRYNLSKLKVGHAGTLDPKASGLLIVCTGKKTKTIKQFENLDKTYVAIIKIGCVTDSFDSETKEKKHKGYSNISVVEIKNIFKEFEGLQQQIPPLFSAIKINGERLYKKARRGDTSIKLKPRNITIHKITLLEFNPPFVKFEVKCSKGTYIRSLASDIGKKLLCGAYLYSLERSHIGQYNLKEAKDLNDIQYGF